MNFSEFLLLDDKQNSVVPTKGQGDHFIDMASGKETTTACFALFVFTSLSFPEDLRRMSWQHRSGFVSLSRTLLWISPSRTVVHTKIYSPPEVRDD